MSKVPAQQRRMPLDPLREGPLKLLDCPGHPIQGSWNELVLASLDLRGDSEQMQK